MEKSKEIIELDIADAIMERPLEFSINGRQFFLYPVTLGKNFLISRYVKSINKRVLARSPFEMAVEAVNLDKYTVSRIIAYHTLKTKDEIFNEGIVAEITEYFATNVNNEQLAELFALVLAHDKSAEFITYIGLDKDKRIQEKVMKLKREDSSDITFGGKSVYGGLISAACEKYGWSMDYVVWGISYVNLKMILADAPNTVYLTKEERKKLRISNDRTFISGDDKRNIEKIKRLCKN